MHVEDFEFHFANKVKGSDLATTELWLADIPVSNQHGEGHCGGGSIRAEIALVLT